MSLDVANRRHELAIRLAVGASPGRLIHSVFVAAAGRAAGGVALGLLAAFAASRVVESLLVGVSTADAPTYMSVAAVVLMVVAVAAYLPARKAAAADPVVLLRR